MAISPQRLTIYLYSAHRAVIFAIVQLSCISQYRTSDTRWRHDIIGYTSPGQPLHSGLGSSADYVWFRSVLSEPSTVYDQSTHQACRRNMDEILPHFTERL